MQHIKDRLKLGAVLAALVLLLSVIVSLLSCKKNSGSDPKKEPTTYSEMFAGLELQFNKEYKFEEWHTNSENGTGWKFTGRAGTILFSQPDSLMTEKYKGYTTKDGFRLSNFFDNYCKFESLGFNKYDTTKSLFISTARTTIQNTSGQTFIGWSTKISGVYSAYQLKIIKP